MELLSDPGANPESKCREFLFHPKASPPLVSNWKLYASEQRSEAAGLVVGARTALACKSLAGAPDGRSGGSGQSVRLTDVSVQIAFLASEIRLES